MKNKRVKIILDMEALETICTALRKEREKNIEYAEKALDPKTYLSRNEKYIKPALEQVYMWVWAE